METQNASSPAEGFQVEDPLAVFEAFSREEMQRWRDTDSDFDVDLHQEAVSLVLNRLKTGATAAELEKEQTK